jgi:hypothetical protein
MLTNSCATFLNEAVTLTCQDGTKFVRRKEKIMQVKWLHHPTCPELNGTTEHVSREVANIAIGFRQAEFVPYNNYVERLNAEGREGNDPHNVVVPFVNGVEFSFGFMPHSGASVIFRKSGTETAIITTVRGAAACGAPRPLVAQLKAALEAPQESAAAFHKARMTQQENDAKFGK